MSATIHSVAKLILIQVKIGSRSPAGTSSFISSNIRIDFQKTGFRLALAVSFLIWVISIYGYLPAIQERRKYLLINAYNQEHNGFGLGHVPFSAGAKYVDKLMKEMVTSGTYIYPKETDELISKIQKIQRPLSSNPAIIATLKDGRILITNSEISVSFERNSGEYAFLRNQSKVYIFKLNQHKYSGRNIFRQYDKGSDTEISQSSLQPGTYDLGIVRVTGRRTRWQIIRSITIP